MTGQRMDENDRLALAALRKLLYNATDQEPEDTSIVEAAQELVDSHKDLQARVQDLEATVERIEATASSPELSKREKHEAIINAAQNKARSGQGGPAGVELGYGEVMAAANVSRRYSYTLMEEIAAKYDWASYDTTGNKNVLKVDVGQREWADLVSTVHTNLSGD